MMELITFLLVLVLPAVLILRFYDKVNPRRQERGFFTNRIKEKKEEKDYWLLIRLFIFQIVITFLTFITKYYPFSLFFQRKIFHYRYKKADEFVKKINNKLYAIPVILDEDNHFFYLYYKQKELSFNKLEKFLKNERVYFSKIENDLIRISIPRD